MSSVFIGLPVYNGAEFLEGALQCLAQQTYSNFRVLIADNASTDSTREICCRFAAKDPRFVYHRHPQNRGAAPNFNFCVEQAQGNYFKWMAHDDLCEPEYLEKCVAALDRDPGAVLVQTRVKCIDNAGHITGRYEKEWDFNTPDPIDRFARAMALNHSCVTVFGVMRLDVLRMTPAIAPFVGSDRSLLAELTLHGRLEYVPEELFLWRDHKNRSVRLKTRRDKLTWFDATAKNILPALYSQQFWASQKAIMRTALPPKAKARAYAKTLQWAAGNYRVFLTDLRSLGGAVVRGYNP